VAKDGRIGNRALLKALADYLQVEGVNRAPDMLHRDQVWPVVSMGEVGGYEFFEHTTIAASVVGQPSYTENIFDVSLRPELRNKTLQVLALDVVIAGNADAADTEMDFQVLTLSPSLAAFIDIPRWETTSAGAAWSRRWAMGGTTVTSFNARSGIASFWNGIIPAGANNLSGVGTGGSVNMGLRLDIVRRSGNFPAASNVTTRGLCVAVPRGVRFPW